MQTSGRVHVTTLFYRAFQLLHFAVIVNSLIPVYIHHDDRESSKTPWWLLAKDSQNFVSWFEKLRSNIGD